MMRAMFAGGLVVGLLTPGSAAGQQGAGELRQLAGQLRPGDRVYVRLTDGYRIKADVGRLGQDSLTLSNGLTLAEEDIQSIELQDSLWTGAALGLGVGVALLASLPVSSDSQSAVVGGVTFFLALPVGVGAIVDASLHRTVYSNTRAVQLSPTVTQGGIGARLSVGW